MPFKLFTAALLTASSLVVTLPVFAQNVTVHEQVITDFRPVVARLEASDSAMARARISGIVTRLNIDEGDVVKKGQVLAIVRDEGINPQIAAINARIAGIENQLAQYQSELDRAQKLLDRGFVTPANRDKARTAVDVTQKSLTGAMAQRDAISANRGKGVIVSPSNARITQVNIVVGSAVSPGEVIAKLATLSGVVRLSLPERHAGQIKQGESLTLRLPARGGETKHATISKIYPELRGGAVVADAVVDGGLSALVGERVDVLVPVGKRRALRISKDYVTTRYGIDFVKVNVGEYIIDAPVILANPKADAEGFVEILSGLRDGDVISPASTSVVHPARKARKTEH
ncbi:MAG: efflux RND transporter periplasmic adaptor subunit [Robiginitomaculum sp.]